ncbi:aspartate--ammonia ligase [Desulfurococcaceae archaeon MEX13E-LK6-19]|nr:aspartate--ammonia ligase [Desulfurococcaceae archaeon MEX13E-LK6-19]
MLAWIAAKDSSKSSLVLRDPSGFKEIKISGSKAEELLKLPRETLVIIEGYYGEGVLHVDSYEKIIVPKEEPPVDYTELPEDIRELATYSPWYMRNPKWASIIKLQQLILWYIREYMYREGFVEILPPMVSPVSDPGLRGAKKLRTTLYGVEHELTSSVIMYKQTTAAIFEKIFFVARNIREEPPENITTGRHLVEFTQVDMEWGLATVEDVIKLAEGLLEYVTKKLVEEHSDLVYSLNKSFEPLKPPFEKISYDEALEIAKKLGYSVEWGKELSHEAESAIASYYDAPVWITGFPVVSRGFYYLPDPKDPKYNRDFNLILPRGYGEVIDGGEREYRYEQLVERIKAMGEPLEKYKWFLETAKRGGIPPSAGWGLGVERFTRYVAGVKHVALATPFPKVPGLPATP